LTICRLLVLTLLLAASALPRASFATEPADSAPTLMVVFDSSGSMWGTLPGGPQAKYVAARDALLQSLPALDVHVRTGLVTFGRGCTGVDVVLPPDVRPQDRTVAPLNAINPRGKGPLAAALLDAAGQIERGRKASLILIHDGPDNCRQDTCTIARDIAASHPGMPIHMVSLGVEATAADALACIAKETGGRVFPAHTLADVKPALDEAIRLALNLEVPAPTPAIRPPAPEAARKPPQADIAADGPPHLVASATFGTSRAVDKPVHWRVFRSGEETVPVLDILETEFAVPLPAGSYVVQAALGRVVARETVEVKEAGPTPVSIAFEAGIARVATRFGSNGAAANIPVLVSVSALDESSGSAPKLKPLLVIPSPSSEFVLPAGTYRITAESGLSQASRDLTIATAAIEDVELDMRAGQLQLSAVSPAGGQVPGDLAYFLSIDDPGAPGGRREVERTAAAAPVLTLPAGTYYITVKAGLYEKHDQVAVGAGQIVKREIVLDAARLKVSASAAIEASDGGAFPIVTRVVSQGPYPREVATSWDAEPEFTLPPGRYRVIAGIGARNVEAAQDVELAPGSEKTVTLSAPAAELRMRLAEGAGVVSTNRFWEVRGPDGKVVWRTSQHTPRALLAPGTYQIRCELRGETLQETVELKPGQLLITKLGTQ